MSTAEGDFVHVEIVGPRAGLDAWLGAIQAAGTCHLVDALGGLEGEPGLGRPRPTPPEQEARAALADLLRRLDPLDPFLPPRVDGDRDDAPAFAVGPAGEGREAFERDVAGAREAADRLQRRLEAARRDDAALDRLREAVGADGPAARRTLDAARDAEARWGSFDRLAASEHVAAVRAWLPREDRRDLERRLEAVAGGAVVVRDMTPSGPPPSPPRRVAQSPFAALEGFLPGGFARTSAPALLALLAPLALGLAWADVGGGLVLLLAGALLGLGAAGVAPRRETAVLAQLAGLMALLGGLVLGRAFGPSGVRLFGEGWGWGGGGASLLEPWRAYLLVLAAGALLAGAWGFLASLRGEARARGASLGGALSLLVAAGLLAAVGAADSPLALAFWLAPAAAAGLLLHRGPRAGAARLLFDLLAFFRVAAVGAAALLAAAWALEILAAPPSLALLAGALALFVLAPLAAVADAAHLAMGVPYDLSLGGRAFGVPYAPFGRARAGRGR